MSFISRMLTAWVALSLFLTLTPCCEIFSAAVAALGSHAVSDHEHDASGGAHQGMETKDHLPDPCMKWLDRPDYAVDSQHVALLAESVSQLNIPLASSYLLGMPDAEIVTPRPYYHPPPDTALPVYLRFEHLLL